MLGLSFRRKDRLDYLLERTACDVSRDMSHDMSHEISHEMSCDMCRVAKATEIGWF